MSLRLGALVAAVTLAGCSTSEPTATFCTASDELAPCLLPTSAVDLGTNAWMVTLRSTESEQVEYVDAGPPMRVHAINLRHR